MRISGLLSRAVLSLLLAAGCGGDSDPGGPSGGGFARASLF